MEVLFGRKIYDIEELGEATEAAKGKGVVGSDYRKSSHGTFI